MVAASHGADAPVILHNFNDLALACVEYEGDLWITGEDVGVALEYANPRIAIGKLYLRNKSELDGYSTTLMLEAGNWVQQPGDEDENPIAADQNLGTQVGGRGPKEGAGPPNLDTETGVPGSNMGVKEPGNGAVESSQRRRIRVYNEEGVMLLTMLSSQPKAAEFRAWAVKTLKAYRHGELAFLEPASREKMLLTCIKEARYGNPVAIDTLIKRFGYEESLRTYVRADRSTRTALRTAHAPAAEPEMVTWFIDIFLPRLAKEIRGTPGPILAAARKKNPAFKYWREITLPGALWTLDHRGPEIFQFATRFALDEEVDCGIHIQLFLRWLGWGTARIEALGWRRNQHREYRGAVTWRLSLLKEAPHG